MDLKLKYVLKKIRVLFLLKFKYKLKKSGKEIYFGRQLHIRPGVVEMDDHVYLGSHVYLSVSALKIGTYKAYLQN